MMINSVVDPETAHTLPARSLLNIMIW
jgi:hypothetical protein